MRTSATRFPFPDVVTVIVVLGPFAAFAGLGVDALIGHRTGCSMVTLPAATGAWSPLAHVAVLLGRWIIPTLVFTVSLLWLAGVILYTMAGINERMRERAVAYIKVSGSSLLVLGVVAASYAQLICLAA